MMKSVYVILLLMFNVKSVTTSTSANSYDTSTLILTSPSTANSSLNMSSSQTTPLASMSTQSTPSTVELTDTSTPPAFSSTSNTTQQENETSTMKPENETSTIYSTTTVLISTSTTRLSSSVFTTSPTTPTTTPPTTPTTTPPTTPTTTPPTTPTTTPPTTPTTTPPTTPTTTPPTTPTTTPPTTPTTTPPTTPTTTPPTTPTTTHTTTESTGGSERKVNGYYFILLFFIIVIIVTIGLGLYFYKRKSITNNSKIASIRNNVEMGILSYQGPIKMSDIQEVVTKLHKDNDLLIALHYEDIQKRSPKHPCEESAKEENQLKNRFVNVIPFDHSRVILSHVDDEVGSDYINANYIPGFNSGKEYIAAQGCLPGTINDFWRMIWEHDISIIVMLTPLKENGRTKCEQYWPSEIGVPQRYGELIVDKVSESTVNTYTYSDFNIRPADDQKKDSRLIKHYHYLSWKDMSAAVERSDVLDFIRTVRQQITPDQTEPIIVHCSAGVGRTGTFITLDYIMQYINTHSFSDSIDIYGYVLKLRDYRVIMVQTESQFAFLFDCAMELIEDKKLKLAEEDTGQEIQKSENIITKADPVDDNNIICNNNIPTTSL